MTSTTHTMSGNASRLEALLNAAHKEPELKRQFLADPVGVAKSRNVQLDEQDAERLRKLGIFAELAREVRVGSLFRVGDPRVWYATQFWLQQEVMELVTDLAYPDQPTATIQAKLDRTLYLGNNPGTQGRGILLDPST